MKTKVIPTFQNRLDSIVGFFFLWFIPESVKPNTLTYIRLITIPVLLYLLSNNHVVLFFVLFVFSALTDLVDGTMARTRDQITETGKWLDPIADKLLIATALLYLGFEYLIVKIFLTVMVIESLGIFLAKFFKNKPKMGANVFGKAKMDLQFVAIVLFFWGYIGNQNSLIKYSEYILFIALGFAFIASAFQIYRFFYKHK